MVAAFFDPRHLCFSEPTRLPAHPSLVPYLPVRCPDSGSVCWKPVEGAPVLPLRAPERVTADITDWHWEEEEEQLQHSETSGACGELIYLFDQGAEDEQAERYQEVYEETYAVFEPTAPYDFQD